MNFTILSQNATVVLAVYFEFLGHVPTNSVKLLQLIGLLRFAYKSEAKACPRKCISK